jgi:hypothetical protein
MKVVFCSTQSESMVAAYNIIAHEINSINDSSPELNGDDELSPASPETIDKDNAISSTTQPFGAYFTQKMKGIQISDCDSGKSPNLYYKPQFFEAIMESWLPLAPFWTALMLGKYLCNRINDFFVSKCIGDVKRHKDESYESSSEVKRLCCLKQFKSIPVLHDYV